VARSVNRPPTAAPRVFARVGSNLLASLHPTTRGFQPTLSHGITVQGFEQGVYQLAGDPYRTYACVPSEHPLYMCLLIGKFSRRPHSSKGLFPWAPVARTKVRATCHPRAPVPPRSSTSTEVR